MEVLHVALNAILLSEDPPEWVELIPAGPNVQGRDGRAWIFDRPDLVISTFKAEGRDLPLDWEHSTELRAPEGLPAPAAAWIQELEDREGALWGRVSWTPKGAETVSNREYRYLSPVFQFEKATSRIVRLLSAGLTNSPNLHLTALNSQETPSVNEELRNRLFYLLNLPITTTDDELLAQLDKLKDMIASSTAANQELVDLKAQLETATAENAQLTGDLQTAKNSTAAPDLDTFVPRPDYDALSVRLQTAENRVQALESSNQEEGITAALDEAQRQGKISPATRDFYAASCRQEGGLDRFKAFAQAAPVIAPANLATPPAGPKAVNTFGLTEEQAAMCRLMNQDPGAFAKTLSQEAL